MARAGKSERSETNCCNACRRQSDIPAVALRRGELCRGCLPIGQTLRPANRSRLISPPDSMPLRLLAVSSDLARWPWVRPARQPAALGAGRLGRMPPVIPGTGIRVARTGDDFEAEDWAYYPQHPKSSWNIDEECARAGKQLEERPVGRRGQARHARHRQPRADAGGRSGREHRVRCCFRRCTRGFPAR